MRYDDLGPTAARHVGERTLDCPWRTGRVSVAECAACRRLVAFECVDGALVVHCRCPQSDAVNDPAWSLGV